MQLKPLVSPCARSKSEQQSLAAPVAGLQIRSPNSDVKDVAFLTYANFPLWVPMSDVVAKETHDHR